MIRCAYILPILTFLPGSLVGTLDAADSDGIRSHFTGRRQIEARRPPQPASCGPNALYMLLRAHGRPVSVGSFFREVEPGDHGLSLAELRDASTRYGLTAEVRRCTYAELIGGCTLPLVALLQPGLGIDHDRAGHYVLVLDADSEGVTLVDGTSGEQNYFPREQFCRDWKGYVVVPAVLQLSWLLLVANTVPVWFVVGWLILRSARPRTGSLTGSEYRTHATATCFDGPSLSE